jgi:hypothetical protein
MATIFPGSASVGQIYEGYSFNGIAWDLIGNEFNPTTFSPDAPDNPKAGDLWVDSDSDVPSISNETILTIDSPAAVPSGGTAGQVLSKIDENDYNTQWVAQSGGGASYEITASTSAPTGGSDGDIWFRHL